MFIKKLQLKNFKRFSDLTIDLEQAPQPPEGGVPKLVLLIGANGSGKSCVFDAFERYQYFTQTAFGNIQTQPVNDSPNPSYLIKYSCEEFLVSIDGYLKSHSFVAGFASASFSKEKQAERTYTFYGRTAFRNVFDLNTKFNARNYGERDVEKVIEKNLDRTVRSIDLDKRWDGDILYCFKEEIDRAELKEGLNKSLDNIFVNNPVGHFQIQSIRSEIGRSIELSLEVLIEKGNSTFPYEYLSAGEKQLFSILLNLHLRKKFLEDTIVYLDEIDLHLNTSIQKDLLKEITENLIPDNSQLWVASHSLGFIDYAQEAKHAAIIDFDNYDFDQEKTLYPSPKSDLEIFEIAVPKEFLSSIIPKLNLTFVEGKDISHYEQLKEPKNLFSIANGRNDVFEKTKKFDSSRGIIDRDFLAEEEIQLIKKEFPRIIILSFYSIENYLCHPENLAEFLKIKFDKEKYIKTLIEIKNSNKTLEGSSINKGRSDHPILKDLKAKHDAKGKSLLSKEQIDKNTESVCSAIESDEFEHFYKFFRMKEFYGKLEETKNIRSIQLSQTDWFRSQIKDLLK